MSVDKSVCGQDLALDKIAGDKPVMVENVQGAKWIRGKMTLDENVVGEMSEMLR